MWKVFERDDYQCRYCGKTGVPLTGDHLILWEHGGPTIEENLLSACRPCNKTRGNMPYKEWLESDYYKKASKYLSPEIKQANKDLISQLSAISKMKVIRSR